MIEINNNNFARKAKYISKTLKKMTTTSTTYNLNKT